MFKVYCHISSLTQCYILYNPLTLLLIKKKIYNVLPRAREEQEYIFTLTLKQTLPFPPRSPKTFTLFMLPQPALLLRNILWIIVRSCSYSFVTLTPTSLAPHYSFTRPSGLRQLGCASDIKKNPRLACSSCGTLVRCRGYMLGFRWQGLLNSYKWTCLWPFRNNMSSNGIRYPLTDHLW
jgi:hypothetical protein